MMPEQFIRTTDDVLKYDIQVLFGKSMKRTDVIKELLPTGGFEVVTPVVEDTSDCIGSLDDWLKELADG